MVRILKKSFIKSFYEDSIKKRKTDKEGLQLISNHFKRLLNIISVKKNSKALDLGYGYGKYTIELARKGFNVTAIDFISPKILKDKIKNSKISKRIKIVKQDLKEFNPQGEYSFILAKDILHLIPKMKIISLLRKLIKLTENGGWHYIAMLVDIKREFVDSGEKIIIEDETNLSRRDFINIIDNLYKDWKIRVISEKHIERNHPGLGKSFNLYSTRITVIANK